METLCKHVILSDENYRLVCKVHHLHYCPDQFIILFSNMKNKCKTLYDFLNNIFFPPPIKEAFTHSFCKVLMLYNRIKRCILNYVHRRMISCNHCDLSCVPLTEYKSSELFELIVQHQKYTFKYSDVYNLIESALLYADEYMISTPTTIKNPYTGIPFTKDILYLLFLKLKHIPPLFYYFMKCHFHLENFLLNYESLLRTYIIQRTLRDFTHEKTINVIKNMITNVTIYNFISGQQEYIIEAENFSDLLSLKPLLIYYYNYLFSLNPYQRHVDHKKLINALLQLRKKHDVEVLSILME